MPNVVFANAMDETAAAADLVFPVMTSLESWDVYESKHAIKGCLQPTLGGWLPFWASKTA